MFGLYCLLQTAVGSASPGFNHLSEADTASYPGLLREAV